MRPHTSLGLALTLVVAACSGGEKRAADQWPLPREQLDKAKAARTDPGELTYRRYCVGCHGGDGRGNEGTTGADLTAASGPLATKQDSELIASVRDGKVGRVASMPAHKPVLKEAQIAEVVRYVRRTFGPGSSASRE